MSKSDNSCNDKEIDGASKSNDDNVCEVKNMLQNIMSTADEEDNDVLVCANCGKEGDDINNTCNKCKKVNYCNAACKKKHRHKHKADCEEHIRLAAEKRNEELKLAAEMHDKKLFKQPPPKDDCPICFLMLPSLGSIYYNCCGKTICSGCMHAPVYDNQGNKVAGKKCPFCRAPHPTTEELQERYKKRVETKDAAAMYNLGVCYRDGLYRFPQDYTKALELWNQAGEFGYAEAYTNIGYAYSKGEGVKVDKKKATYYYELGAMGGNVNARHNLGLDEAKAGNIERALRHYMIAVRSGQSNSLKMIKLFYSAGRATKDDYTKALQLYQEYLGEIKSVQRDEAAAADERNHYY